MGKLTDQQKIELVNLYTSTKHNCSSLGRLYCLDSSSVRSLLLRRGIQLKTASETCRRYNLDQSFFDEINSESKAYFLGLLYADGYNNTQRGEIHLSLQEEDKHILEKLQKEVQSNRPLLFVNLSKRGNRKQKDIYRFDISSQKISKRLKELGCDKAKTMILKFPKEHQVPTYLLSHFIRGYFDGDGCFVNSRVKGKYQQYSISIVSTEDFCKSLQEICKEKIYITTFLSKRHKDRNDVNRNFHVSGNRQVIKFLNWIYQDATIYLNRKFEKYKNIKKPVTEPMFPAS